MKGMTSRKKERRKEKERKINSHSKLQHLKNACYYHRAGDGAQW